MFCSFPGDIAKEKKIAAPRRIAAMLAGCGLRAAAISANLIF